MRPTLDPNVFDLSSWEIGLLKNMYGESQEEEPQPPEPTPDPEPTEARLILDKDLKKGEYILIRNIYGE